MPYLFRGEIPRESTVSRPGQTISTARFKLDDNWMTRFFDGSRLPLSAVPRPGKHTVQAVVSIWTPDRDDRHLRGVSNPVEIEILPSTK